MDKLNIKILKELQLNARASFSEIGRNVGLSAPSVAERIQKLEQAGIIEGYSVKLNMEKLGLEVNAIINLDISFVRFKDLISKINDFPEIYEFLKVTGKQSVILKAVTTNNLELEDLIDRLSTFGQPQTSIILSSYINKPILIPKEK